MAGRRLGACLDLPVHSVDDAVWDPDGVMHPTDDIDEVIRAAQDELDAPRYDHNAWFFGAGRHPRWAGYRLGYALVGEWLAAKPDRTASGAISVPASEILSGLDILSGDDQPD